MSAKTKRASSSVKRRYSHKPRGVSDKTFEKIHWPYLPILMIALFLISVTAHTGVLQAAVKNPSGKVLAYASSMSVSGLLSSTNSARAAEGSASLSLSSKLNAAAQAKAQDMAERNYWSHNTPEGDPPWIFVTAQGYAYQKLGENLAAGFNDEQSTINGWLASPPHKENLIDTAFTEVGFGFANNANYTSAGGGPMTIVVAFYGKPTSSSPAPAPVAQNNSSAPKPSSSSQPAAPAPTETGPAPEAPSQEATSEQTPAEIPQSTTQAPVTTDNPTSGVSLAMRTSRAQVAFAKIPLSSFATGLSSFAMLAAAGYWVSHHLFALRRAWARSESFVFRHPLFDLAIVVIIGISYLLTRTAGFIQ